MQTLRQLYKNKLQRRNSIQRINIITVQYNVLGGQHAQFDCPFKGFLHYSVEKSSLNCQTIKSSQYRPFLKKKEIRQNGKLSRVFFAQKRVQNLLVYVYCLWMSESIQRVFKGTLQSVLRLRRFQFTFLPPKHQHPKDQSAVS